MRVLILHDEIPPGARADEADALVQARVIADALRDLGHEPRVSHATLDLASLRASLETDRPDLVLNLVESLAGKGALIHLVPSLLDALRVPYTGCPANAIAATSDKVGAKRLLRLAGVDTPAFATLDDLRRGVRTPPARWIVKSVWEHASVGLDEDSVVHAEDAQALRREIESRLPAMGGEGFAEEYIDGREFNISVLEREGQPVVLPHAEIEFLRFGDRPRVVGYRAKWDDSSEQYHNTPRRFDFPGSDAPLLEDLARTSIECWRLFGLRGYARVDFRVRADGSPTVLEVNTNPCLSPDAGFMAAASRAGLAVRDVVRDIVAAGAPVSVVK